MSEAALLGAACTLSAGDVSKICQLTGNAILGARDVKQPWRNSGEQ